MGHRIGLAVLAAVRTAVGSPARASRVVDGLGPCSLLRPSGSSACAFWSGVSGDGGLDSKPVNSKQVIRGEIRSDGR